MRSIEQVEDAAVFDDEFTPGRHSSETALIYFVIDEI
jgi:hypothetical protein